LLPKNVIPPNLETWLRA